MTSLVPMNEKDFVSSKGEMCPSCGGTSLDRAPPSYPERGEITAWVACEACRHVWRESYHLSGYSELQVSTVPPAEN